MLDQGSTTTLIRSKRRSPGDVSMAAGARQGPRGHGSMRLTVGTPSMVRSNEAMSQTAVASANATR